MQAVAGDTLCTTYKRKNRSERLCYVRSLSVFLFCKKADEIIEACHHGHEAACPEDSCPKAFFIERRVCFLLIGDQNRAAFGAAFGFIVIFDPANRAYLHGLISFSSIRYYHNTGCGFIQKITAK